MKLRSDSTHDVICVGQASIDSITNHSRTVTNLVGGAAIYTSVISSSLGLRSGVVAHVGNNDYSHFKSFLDTFNVDVSGIHIKSGSSTKIELFYEGQELKDLKIFEGVGAELSEQDVPDSYFTTKILYVAPAPYNTQVQIARKMREKGVVVAFDPHADYNSRPFSMIAEIIASTDIFFANEFEMVSLSKVNDLEKAVEKVQNAGSSIVIVTRGEKGANIYLPEKVISLPAFRPTALVDVVGAGDSFKAGFFVGLCKNLSLEDCGLLGAATASCILEGFGLERVPDKNVVHDVLARNGKVIQEWQEEL